MKKIFTLLMLFVAFTFTANAQLADGSIAPDWTLTDINGTEHNLYSYLDQGYTVVLDFSATWCGPCWGYHTSGALEDLYAEHGPAGMPNVSSETTDDVMVFMIEGDGTTTNEDLIGNTAATQGDWVAGTPYPIIDSDAITGTYQIGFWPTIYSVCPNREITHVGQIGTDSHLDFANACGFAQYDTDGRISSLNSPTFFCGDAYDAELTIQNLSTETTMTEATISVTQNGEAVYSHNWEGSLETYDSDQVSFSIPSADFNTTDPLVFAIVVANDMDVSNDLYSATISNPTTEQTVTVEIMTDQYGSETSWDIKDANNTIVGSGSGYGNNTLITEEVSLSSVECYTFTIYDSYGDGICCTYGEGYYSLKDSDGNQLLTGGVFASSENASFKNDMAAVSVEEITAIANLKVYPNPVNETATVAFNLVNNLDTKIEIVNILGEVVYVEDLGSLSNGQHTANIDVKALKNGVYFLNIISEGNISSKKITINK